MLEATENNMINFKEKLDYTEGLGCTDLAENHWLCFQQRCASYTEIWDRQKKEKTGPNPEPNIKDYKSDSRSSIVKHYSKYSFTVNKDKLLEIIGYW